MDWGSVFDISFNASFLTAVLSIILIDLVLAGDNAVVIAMAVRNLAPDQRKRGILLGAGAAVSLRIIATFFVSQLLNITLVKLAGGAAILWIGVKLFVDGMPDDGAKREARTLWQAVKLIVIADITLSIDNMLAVGGASHGNLFLLLFGLTVSVPFVVFTSNFLSPPHGPVPGDHRPWRRDPGQGRGGYDRDRSAGDPPGPREQAGGVRDAGGRRGGRAPGGAVADGARGAVRPDRTPRRRPAFRCRPGFAAERYIEGEVS